MVIRRRKSKKGQTVNGRKKGQTVNGRKKGQAKIYKTLIGKLKIEQHEPH